MSIESLGINLGTGAVSFCLAMVKAAGSAIFSFVVEERIRQHEKDMLIIANAKEYSKESLRDLQSVRSLSRHDFESSKGSFTGWTRRIFTFSLISVVMGVVIAWFTHVKMNIPITTHHSFLFWHWTTTIIVAVQGLFMLPWLPPLIFMGAGFYYGRSDTRIVYK